jgi:hypothetical protein
MTIAHPNVEPLRADLSGPLLDEGWSIFRLAAPIMFICLVNMGMSVTDAVMVSALFGAEALAAVAVGNDLYSILFYLGTGVLAGFAPLYTAAAVRGDRDERLRLERSGRMAVALIAAFLVPLVWTAPSWLARLGLDPYLLSQGQGYTRAMAVTLVPMRAGWVLSLAVRVAEPHTAAPGHSQRLPGAPGDRLPLGLRPRGAAAPARPARSRRFRARDMVELSALERGRHDEIFTRGDCTHACSRMGAGRPDP